MRPYLWIKRVVDIILALCLLILLAPLFAVVALLIRADSPGPVIFKQERVGKDEKLFRVYKFRTMVETAPASVATSELKNAPRYITRMGRVLRKSSIDELPQLINILRGEMSLIGPRPLVPQETEIHQRRSELGAYAVLPGITGWAQVNGRDCVDPQTKAALDAYYACHVSPFLDIKVLAYSVLCVVTARGIKEGGGNPEDVPEEVPLCKEPPLQEAEENELKIRLRSGLKSGHNSKRKPPAAGA
ncbi:MAG TPA: sugar transferase [Clostridia bacterium]|nr:sugar transferase [Clostridia bacterium]